MRSVWQILPTMSFGDAVGNDTLAIDRLLQSIGVNTGIFAQNIHPKLARKVESFDTLSSFMSEDDILIYHLSTGTEITEWVAKQKNKIVLVYHNITPSKYFLPYNGGAVELTKQAREQMITIAKRADLAVADSQYNADELVAAGASEAKVIPILIPFADYDRKPDAKWLRSLMDGKTNILFVGRIAPNKCQEDIISTFAEYHHTYNPKSRLILAGNEQGMELYSAKLHGMVKELQLSEDVIFTGHCSFEAILACYHAADAFLCMSEHEGFCVPLVEAMHFALPIMAADYTAVGETLGDGGILLAEKDPAKTAAVLHTVLSDTTMREALSQAASKECARFATEKIEKQWKDLLLPFIQ